ncbi:hypothetical protein BROC_01129 [Candidatus Brocadiaceae bacterium]|nr:hypothetical protein BROC_01129 [Candidatus Brocadiaceae bacterium]
MKTAKNFFNKIIRNKIILFAVLILILVILTDSIFKTILFIYDLNKSNNSDISVLITSMKDIINIMFFIIVALITILSYVLECAPQSRQVVKVGLREGNHGKNIKKKIYT